MTYKSSNLFQSKVQSHEVSMFGSFRYSTRKGGGEHTAGIEVLTDELDSIIETEDDQIKYGANTEFDAMDFTQEMFGRFYGQAEKKSENEWSVAHEQLDGVDEIAKLKRICKGDPDLSLLASNYVLHSMSEDIANILREYREYAEDPDNQDEDGNPDPTNFYPSGETQVGLTANGKKLEELVKELEEAKPLIEMMGSKDAAGGEDGEVDRNALVKQLMDKNSVLRKIMKIVGRLNNAVSGLKANSLSEELTDTEITVGKGKYSDLVNTEKTYLADDATLDKFYSRHIRRQQFMFRKKGRNKKVGGPVTVLIDESGSMRGQRQDIAKSVAAALFAMASEQSRDCTVIGFDHTITYLLKKKRKSKLSLLNNYISLTDMSAIGFIANRCTYGGTDFTVAIRRGLKESRGKNADILFITDGEDSISSTWLDKLRKSKDKDGTRIFTILLGCGNESLRSVSDAVLPFYRLTDESIDSLAKLMKSMER